MALGIRDRKGKKEREGEKGEEKEKRGRRKEREKGARENRAVVFVGRMEFGE